MLIFREKSAKYVFFPSKWLIMLFFKKLKEYVKKYVLCKSHKNLGPVYHFHFINDTTVCFREVYKRRLYNFPGDFCRKKKTKTKNDSTVIRT